MKNTENIISIIRKQGIIPLFYHDDLTVCIEVIDALYKAGIRVVEYTNRGKKAINNIEALIQTREQRWSKLLLGVGTIKTAGQVKNFIAAGADFIICPGVLPEVAKATQSAGLLWVPGCMTPTEIMVAEQSGARLVKLFPGSLLSPSYVSAVKEIFPDLMFMPTGGVDVSEENIGAWFKAGVCAVGLGSKVISKELMKRKDYGTIGALAKKALMITRKIKSQIRHVND